MFFKNREIVVVTASSQGIGEACALNAVKFGAGGVIVNGRKRETIEAVAAKVRAMGVGCHAFVADLTDTSKPAELIRFGEQMFGRVDVLVNSLGCSDRSTLESVTADEIHRMFGINVIPMVLCTQAMIDQCVRNGVNGSVVNNLSMNGYVSQPNLVAYGLTKAAGMNFTQTQGHEMSVRHAKSRGEGGSYPWIRVNAVATPWTNSPGETAYKRQENPETPDDWYQSPPLSGVPRGVMTTVDEVAETLLFLASCTHVNGQVWAVEQFNLAGPPDRSIKAAATVPAEATA